MTPASAVRASVAFTLVVGVIFVVDVFFAFAWPARSPEVVRGLVGALVVLMVGA